MLNPWSDIYFRLKINRNVSCCHAELPCAALKYIIKRRGSEWCSHINIYKCAKKASCQKETPSRGVTNDLPLRQKGNKMFPGCMTDERDACNPRWWLVGDKGQERPFILNNATVAAALGITQDAIKHKPGSFSHEHVHPSKHLEHVDVVPAGT